MRLEGEKEIRTGDDKSQTDKKGLLIAGLFTSQFTSKLVRRFITGKFSLII